jgi:hypothetical protein
MRYLAFAVILMALSFLPAVVPLASAQTVRVMAIPQTDCPLTVEQHENGADGSLKTADFANFSKKMVASFRVGLIVGADETSKTAGSAGPSEPTILKSTELRPGLTPGGRVTVSAGELGMQPATTGRQTFYVASGYFEDGERFVCSAKAIRKRAGKDGHVVAVRGR